MGDGDLGCKPLSETDPEIYDLLKAEDFRQRCSIELIASENFTSRAVLDCLGSCFTNKYSEGYPGKRFYGGNEVIDSLELLCQERALRAFRLDPSEWGVNVQPYSGSPANFAVYTALLRPHDRIMGLDVPSGGHLTHGFYTAAKRVSATSIFFESLPYKVNRETGLIDYDELEKQALIFRPNIIIAGVSAYSRHLDYGRFRAVADSVGAILMADMSHVSGLVAAELTSNPFVYCDVVTSTTHKTLRGPRSAMIFYNKKIENMETRIKDAVFPGLQGGPHNNQIAALACQLLEVQSPQWKVYCTQIIRNIRALSSFLCEKGYKIVTNGTDVHMIVWDLTPECISGAKMQFACDLAGITLNMNCVPGDHSALNPSGIRIGSPAMTTRGLVEDDFLKIGGYLHSVVLICKSIQEKSGKKLADFKEDASKDASLKALAQEIKEWCLKFPMPGFSRIDERTN